MTNQIPEGLIELLGLYERFREIAKAEALRNYHQALLDIDKSFISADKKIGEIRDNLYKLRAYVTGSALPKCSKLPCSFDARFRILTDHGNHDDVCEYHAIVSMVFAINEDKPLRDNMDILRLITLAELEQEPNNV
jgi:hypothetical protein